MRKIKNLIDCFLRGLAFFKIGFTNYDFDWHYLIILMEFKLRRMEKVIRNGNNAEANKVADQVKVAIALCERISNCNYLENVLNPHEEKWGIRDWYFIPCEDTTTSYSQLKWKKYPKAKNEKENKQAEKEYTQLCKHSDMLEKQDIEYLLIYLKKHLKGWWD